MDTFVSATVLGVMLLIGQAACGAELEYQGLTIPDQSGKAVTVLGPVNPVKLGRSLVHEHLFVTDWIPLDEPERWARLGQKIPVSKEDLDIRNARLTTENRHKLIRNPVQNVDALTTDDINVAIDEVEAYQELGGQTIVDLTNIGLGRKPEKLREVSKQTGINIVMGTGFFRWEFHPKGLEKRSIAELTKIIVRDIVEGVGVTGIKAGVIGEIPTRSLAFSPNESEEVRVLRAAARASRLTGASISFRCPPGVKAQLRYLHKLLDIVEEEGADLSRVAVGHLSITADNFEFLETLLERGVYLQYDTFALPYPTLIDNVGMLESIHHLVLNGYSKRILVSQDYVTKYTQTRFGGYGLTFIESRLLPALRARGVGDAALKDIIENNPRRILTFVEPQALLTM